MTESTSKRTKSAADSLFYIMDREGYPKDEVRQQRYKKLLSEADLSAKNEKGLTVLAKAEGNPKFLRDLLAYATVEDLLIQVPDYVRRGQKSVINLLMDWNDTNKEILLNSDVVQKNQDQLLTPEIWEWVKSLSPKACSLFSKCKGWKDEYLIYSHLRWLWFDDYYDPNILDLKEAEDFMLHSPLTKNPKMRQLARDILASVKRIRLWYGGEDRMKHLDENSTYNLEINLKDLDYLATELCPNVEKLILPDCAPPRITNNISDEHIRIISKFKKLKFLRVFNQLSHEDIKILASMDSLEELQFDNHENKDISVSLEDIQALSKLPNLKEIVLPYQDQKGMEMICPPLIRDRYIIYAPKSKVYKEKLEKYKEFQKALELQKARKQKKAEHERILSSLGEDWQKKLLTALEQKDKELAFKILESKGLIKIEEPSSSSEFGREERRYDGPIKSRVFMPGPDLPRWGNTHITWSGETIGKDIAAIDNKNIAVGRIINSQSWRSTLGYNAGIGWNWGAHVDIINLDKGTVASASTRSIQVRDPQYPTNDIFGNIPTQDFLTVDGKKVTVSLGGYASASVEIPQLNLKKTLTKSAVDSVKTAKEKQRARK